jgi:hypothetical protein
MRRAGVPDAPAASDDLGARARRAAVRRAGGPVPELPARGVGHARARPRRGRALPELRPPRRRAGSRSSALSLPMAADGRTVGALNLYSRDRTPSGARSWRSASCCRPRRPGVQAAVAYYSSRDLAGPDAAVAMGSAGLIEQAKGVLVARERHRPRRRPSSGLVSRCSQGRQPQAARRRRRPRRPRPAARLTGPSQLGRRLGRRTRNGRARRAGRERQRCRRGAARRSAGAVEARGPLPSPGALV